MSWMRQRNLRDQLITSLTEREYWREYRDMRWALKTGSHDNNYVYFRREAIAAALIADLWEADGQSN